MYPSKSKKSHAASVLPDQDVVAIGKLVSNIGVDARIEEPLGMQTTLQFRLRGRGRPGAAPRLGASLGHQWRRG